MDKNKYVLVLEDNTSDVLVAKYLLEQNNYVPITANDGFAALDLLDQYPFVLLIVDLNMPMMSGIDFLKRAKAHSQTHNIPMLVVSAKNETKDVKKAIEAGASDYIIKPIDPTIFSTKVNSLVTQSPTQWYEYQIDKNSENSLVSFQHKAELSSVSEFSFTVNSNLPLNIGDTVEIDSRLLKNILSTSVMGRVVSCEKKESQYLITFSYVGISEKERKEIRIQCRDIWTQNKR